MTTAAEYERWADGLVTKTPGKAAKTAAARLADDAADLRALGEVLVAALDRAERCRVCGRALRDPVSVSLRIGPECRRPKVAA